MNYRFADGSDKIAAFERGMSDEDADLAFETSGVTAVVIEESYLLAYSVSHIAVTERLRLRLFDGPGNTQHITQFLRDEAQRFGAKLVIEAGCGPVPA